MDCFNCRCQQNPLLSPGPVLTRPAKYKRAQVVDIPRTGAYWSQQEGFADLIRQTAAPIAKAAERYYSTVVGEQYTLTLGDYTDEIKAIADFKHDISPENLKDIEEFYRRAVPEAVKEREDRARKALRDAYTLRDRYSELLFKHEWFNKENENTMQTQSPNPGISDIQPMQPLELVSGVALGPVATELSIAGHTIKEWLEIEAELNNLRTELQQARAERDHCSKTLEKTLADANHWNRKHTELFQATENLRSCVQSVERQRDAWMAEARRNAENSRHWEAKCGELQYQLCEMKLRLLERHKDNEKLRERLKESEERCIKLEAL